MVTHLVSDATSGANMPRRLALEAWTEPEGCRFVTSVSATSCVATGANE